MNLDALNLIALQDLPRPVAPRGFCKADPRHRTLSRPYGKLGFSVWEDRPMGSCKGWELEGLMPDVRLDLRGMSDSLTYAKVCRQLEQMGIGHILELLVSDGWSLLRLSIDLRGDGHRLLKVEAMSDRTGYRIWMEKGTGCTTNAEGIDGDCAGTVPINTDGSRRADQYRLVSPAGD